MSAVCFSFAASSEVGFGHFARAKALAGALRAAGVATTADIDAEVRNFLGDRVDDIGPPGSGQVVVVDDYHADLNEVRRRHPLARIATFDDFGNDPSCDIVIETAPVLERRIERTRDGFRLSGPEFLSIDADFAELALVDARPASAEVQTILVAPGGTDPTGLAACALEALESAGFQGNVVVALSSRANHLDALRRESEHLGERCRLLLDTSDMPGLIAKSDLAIGAPGISAAERACLGLPSILVVTAENQQRSAASFTAHDAAIVAKRADLATSIQRLLGAIDERISLSLNGRRMVDGLGARRVALALAPVFDREGRAILTSRVRPEDEDAILQWQNEPGARTFSETPGPISKEDHAAYMKGRLSPGRGPFEIIYVDATPVGFLRLDVEGQTATLSYLVQEESRRRGIGRAILEIAKRLLPSHQLQARVHPDNKASLRAFKAALWTETKNHNGQGHSLFSLSPG